MRKISRLSALALLAVSSSQAAYYFGTLNISGPGVTTTTTLIDFQPTTNNATSGLGNTGSFSGIVSGILGTVQDIPPLAQNNWLTGAGLPGTANWNLGGLIFTATPVCTASMEANFIGTGSSYSCLGQAGSPIVLTRTFAGTSATLDSFGTIVDGADISGWTGLLSAQFNNLNPIQVACLSGSSIDGCAVGTGSPVVTWSANFTVTTPEPSSVALGLTGLALLGLGLRRKK